MTKENLEKIIENITDKINDNFEIEHSFCYDLLRNSILSFKQGKQGEVDFWEFNEIKEFKQKNALLINIHTHSYYIEEDVIFNSEIYPSLDDFHLFIISSFAFQYHAIISSDYCMSFFEFNTDHIRIDLLDYCNNHHFFSRILVNPKLFYSRPLNMYQLHVYYEIIKKIDNFYNVLERHDDQSCKNKNRR